MTRALLALACALLAGCAAARSGGGARRGVVPSTGVQPENAHVALGARAAAPADSMTLSWHAPSLLRRRGVCDTDTVTAHDRQTQAVLRLNTVTPPCYYGRGCEASVACWDSVRAFNVPDTVAWLTAAPGESCAVSVGPGQYVVVARNGAGWSCWSAVKVVK